MQIAISGSIGAGKSTLSQQLSAALGYEVRSEPVHENPYLSDFYADPDRWAFPAQVYMVSHRFQQGVAHKVHGGPDLILDRCFHEDIVFAQVNHALGHISDRDWNVYQHLYQSFGMVLPPPDVIIYLRTTPQLVRDRITQRGRVDEQGISLEYLTLLHDAYEDWILQMQSRTKVAQVNWTDFNTPGFRGVLECLVSFGIP